MGDEITSNIYWDAYELGYRDELATCPYPEGTHEANVWNRGYEDGSRNC